MTIQDALGIILLTALGLMFLFGLLIPKMGNTIREILSRQAAEVVSSQLANYMTITGASPYDIVITYNPSRKFTYHITVRDGVLETIPNYTTSVYRSSLVFDYYATPFKDYEEKNVNLFVINKVEGRYSILAEKV